MMMAAMCSANVLAEDIPEAERETQREMKQK